jgi:cytochrome c peroxidase
MKWLPLLIFTLFFFLAGFLWQQRHYAFYPTDVADEKTVPASLTNEPITPIALFVELDEKKVALGEQLFNDVRLSRDNSISCASCHILEKGGTDQLTISTGIGGKPGVVNAPSVFNSVYNFKQFWDGRAETLEEQIEGPTHNPVEMDSNWTEIITKLEAEPNYVQAFRAIYLDKIQSRDIKDAIATYERSLVTPNARFDKFLRGDNNALTDEEKQGYQLFKSYGCVSCHQGVNIGGNLFQKFGLMGDYFASRKVTKADLGRFNSTGNEADKFVFKVPSLRNVARTAPYFHDGSAHQLEDAVMTMSVYQLGRPLTLDDRDAIVKFLKTLSGEYKGKTL